MKRTIKIASIVLVISVIVYGVVWLFDEPNKRPIRPTVSEPNKILITSNACCLMTYDLKLTLHNKQTEENSVLCSAEQVSEFDVFKYNVSRLQNQPVSELRTMLSNELQGVTNEQ